MKARLVSCWTWLLVGGMFFASTRVEAGMITATNSVFGIFDDSSGTRTVAFDGTEAGFETGIISKVTLSISFIKADGEGPTIPANPGIPFFNEIVFRLTSPMGTIVNLINEDSFNIGASGTIFDGVITFDDAAAQVVNVNPNLVQPGTFRPIGSLTTLNGQSALGTFTLFIEDTVGADALRFRSFTLNITTVGAPPVRGVPEPASITLATLGATGLLGFRWFRRKRPLTEA